MTQLIKINPSEFGLEETQAATITAGLTQIINEREILAANYAETIKLELVEANIPKFKELRRKIADNRTKGIEKWHKTNKEFYLRGGQFVDAIKRKESAENERMEANLLECEKHFENLEKARLEALQQERSIQLESYEVENLQQMDLKIMSEDVFSAFLQVSKEKYLAKKEAERVAEEKRLAEIEAEKQRIEAQRIENERLKAEAEEREKKIEEERKEAQRLLDIEKAKAEKARIEAEEKAKAEREKQIQLHSKRNEELRPYIVLIRDYSKLLNSSEEDYQKELSDIKRGEQERIEFEKEQSEKRFKKMEAFANSFVGYIKSKGYEESVGGFSFRGHFIGENTYSFFNSENELEEMKERVDKHIESVESKDLLEKHENERKQREEDELKAKKESEKLAKAPVKKQLNVWVGSFNLPEITAEHEAVNDIKAKFAAFKDWATKQVENI